jgi:hypothetical protein
MDPLTLTIILFLFSPYINITSQKFSSTPFHLLLIILYSSPPYGSTLVLSGYLLFRHSCTWDKTSIFWSCQQTSKLNKVGFKEKLCTPSTNFRWLKTTMTSKLLQRSLKSGQLSRFWQFLLVKLTTSNEWM